MIMVSPWRGLGPLAGVLIGILAVGPSTVSSEPHALRAIEPLIVDGEGVICTTFAIGAAGRWMTALHCQPEAVDTPNPETPAPVLRIAGMATEVVAAFPTVDLLVLQTPIGVTPLRLAAIPPSIGDRVSAFGYGLGAEQGFFTTGVVAQTSIVFEDRPRAQFLVTMPVCGGMSGSPIVTAAGQVVSVFQRMTGRPCAPFGLGPTLADLTAFTWALWDAPTAGTASPLPN